MRRLVARRVSSFSKGAQAQATMDSVGLQTAALRGGDCFWTVRGNGPTASGQTDRLPLRLDAVLSQTGGGNKSRRAREDSLWRAQYGSRAGLMGWEWFGLVWVWVWFGVVLVPWFGSTGDRQASRGLSSARTVGRQVAQGPWGTRGNSTCTSERTRQRPRGYTC
jgi:hypothetical protein